MANLLNSNETPNLLELVEAYDAAVSMLADISVCGDEARDNGLPSDLIDLSFCSDEGQDVTLSVCADEGPPADHSICADEISSDVRLKTDIARVGTTVYGLPLYHFRYKTGTERFEGVMAQDVLELMPGAVVVGEDGYYRVKYSQLGIKMTRA